MLIHRSVCEDIEKKLPNLRQRADGLGGQWFTSSEHKSMDNLRKIREFLEAGPMTGEKAVKAYEMVLPRKTTRKQTAVSGWAKT